MRSSRPTIMRANLYHRIISHPQPEDAGTVTITAMIEGYDSTFTTTASSVKELFDEVKDPCKSGVDFYLFLKESGIDEEDVINGLTKVLLKVLDVSTKKCSASSDYSPGCALQVSLFLLHPRQAENVDQTSSANNFVVKSLPRKMYEKVISSTDEDHCTVCLDEFNKGARVMTSPCEHYYHDECAVLRPVIFVLCAVSSCHVKFNRKKNMYEDR